MYGIDVTVRPMSSKGFTFFDYSSDSDKSKFSEFQNLVLKSRYSYITSIDPRYRSLRPWTDS